VTPGNRRVRKPQIPPEVLEAAGVPDIDALEDAPPPDQPLADARGSVPPGSPSPPSARRSSPNRDRQSSPSRERKRAVAAPSSTPSRGARAIVLARAVLGAILVVGLSIAVAWAARRHVTSSARFAVTDIDVTGTKHRSVADVERESGLARGSNVFNADLDAARAKLLADPWISDATFARVLPGTIRIQVTEREAGAIVALGDTYLATRDGDIFKKLEVGDPDTLPVVTGMLADSVTTDREGAKRTIRRAIDLAAEYDESPLAKKATLQEVHVSPDGAFTLIVGKNAVALELGDAPYRKKLEEAARVLSELEKRNTRADTIMLDNEARPERVVVRVR
jgi:cell division protein FtsQ